MADLLVRGGAPCGGTEIGGELVPRLIDELPVLAVAAALARGRTEIRDAGELRVKESDRLAALARELSRLGVSLRERPDGMVIQGAPPDGGRGGEPRGSPHRHGPGGGRPGGGREDHHPGSGGHKGLLSLLFPGAAPPGRGSPVSLTLPGAC